MPSPHCSAWQLLRVCVYMSCQVGFTKQDIIPDYSIGGEMAEEWAPNSADYRLLCPDGGCSPVDEYADCTAAKVPSRAGEKASALPPLPPTPSGPPSTLLHPRQTPAYPTTLLGKAVCMSVRILYVLMLH